MDFTKEQLSELICKHTEKENGVVFHSVCLKAYSRHTE